MKKAILLMDLALLLAGRKRLKALAIRLISNDYFN